jgi:gluconolactonase
MPVNLPASSMAILSAAFLAVLALPVWSADEADGKAKVKEVKIEDITLSVPATSEQKPASNRLRLAQFNIPKSEGDPESAELVVSFFGGGGGGSQANVERWIGQFQQKERNAKVTSGKSPQGEYIFVEITGTYKKPPPPANTNLPDARMLG